MSGQLPDLGSYRERGLARSVHEEDPPKRRGRLPSGPLSKYLAGAPRAMRLGVVDQARVVRPVISVFASNVLDNPPDLFRCLSNSAVNDSYLPVAGKPALTLLCAAAF